MSVARGSAAVEAAESGASSVEAPSAIARAGVSASATVSTRKRGELSLLDMPHTVAATGL